MDVIDFRAKFKDGDFILMGWDEHWFVIYSHLRDARDADIGYPKHAIMYHAVANTNGSYISIPDEVRPGIGYIEDYTQARLATNEEISKFISRMEARGKTWDFEHKTITNLIRAI